MFLHNANWNYPTTIWFGNGRIKELNEACKKLNIQKPLLVTDPSLAKSNMFNTILKNNNFLEKINIFSNINFVHVPKTYDKLSTKRLLTMSWLDGEPILNFKKSPKETRNTLAANMYKAWYKPFFEYGVLHGDPHLGNYSVQKKDLSINIYDFGCMRIFNGNFIQGVIDLYFALQEKDNSKAVHAYEHLSLIHI